MSEDRIVESIGKLTGLVEASREDIKTLVEKHDTQTNNISLLTTSIRVIETNYKNHEDFVNRELKQVNEKLCRDYDDINGLKKKSVMAEGVDAYHEKKRSWWHYVVAVGGGIIAIIIGLNQLYGFFTQMKTVQTPSVQSVYSAPLTPSKIDTSKIDTSKVDTSIKSK